MPVVCIQPENCKILQANTATGSTFIELDEVRVPVENRIGEENKGFPLIMSSEFSRVNY